MSFTRKNHVKFDPNISKRKFIRNDLNVNYSKKGTVSKSVDYLGPSYFNDLDNYIKRYLRLNININKSLTNVFIIKFST